MKRFNVAHQKVSVDVNLKERTIRGWTELTVIPLVDELAQIELDARQMRIENVSVNSIETEFEHNDILCNLRQEKDLRISEHAKISSQLATVLSDQCRDLRIKIPQEISVASEERSAETFVSSTNAKSYSALTVRIDFSLDNPVSGVNFVSSGKPSTWHAYTTHNPISQSTSCWLPCLDGLQDPYTWEMEFCVPKSVGDLSGDQEDETEIVVICNSNSPTQVAHPFDPSKKIVRFEMFTPIFAHHLGFTVGPFVQVSLSSNDYSAESNSGIPCCIYALQASVDNVRHCCGIYSQAMEYFTREFGSFPFMSYSICFVQDLPFEAADAAGLTIISDKLLFPPSVIEPLFDHTQPLIRCLAAQWCGVNIVAATWNDVWVTEGIALFMTHTFIRRLMGNNEYRMRMKMFVDEITRQDINMPPIGEPKFRFPITVDDLRFIRLKAPMVLYILNRRMIKTDRSLGLSRVIPKILLQSMSGDLNSQISTAHFRKLCERVAHHRLDAFFNEWVHGSGYPIFRVTQRFNKKRMFIEMGIGQVQSRELPEEVLRDTQFLDKAVNNILNRGQNYPVAAAFSGPMTIRIHEADGTPYEHVVDLKEGFTKLDIQYNTKYKRLKRNQKFKGQESGNADDGLINCLGDVLMKDEEMAKWRLTDWGQDEEEFMFNEAFEWIRVDSDFEWICKMTLGQPDYMYASQLQQDRDVVAQYDAVTFFSNQKPSAIYSSILTRTLMDWRYFYQVRAHAALGLARNAVETNDNLGMFHLLKVFEEMCCFEDSLIPRANDFSDFSNYFVQKALISAFAKIRNKEGQCPDNVMKFLLNLIRYNENSGNPYSDSYYLCTIIEAVTETIKSADSILKYDPQFQEFVTCACSEIDKCQRLDLWLPSYHHIISTTAVYQDEALIKLGYGTPRMDKLLLDTSPSNNNEIRLASFQVVLELGGYRDPNIIKYVFQTMMQDTSLVIRTGLTRILAKLVGIVAIEGEFHTEETRADLMLARQEAIARGSVHTSIPVVRKYLGKHEPLKSEIMQALHNPRATATTRRVLLDICQVLYPPEQSRKNYQLTARRKGEDFLMVLRYRNVNKMPKIVHRPEPDEEYEEEYEERKPISLKLKLTL